jgi:HlyD family secretion protein
VEARIVVSEKPDALTVPAGALFRDGTDWCVFRETAGHTASLSRLRIGERNDEAAEVLEGLAEGDRVVLHPGDKVREGVGLRARE